MRDYWQKQTSAHPLFSDLLWSRPENRATAGKLLIVGGNQHGFAAPAEAYAMASQAGIGTARVLLPLAIKKVAGGLLPDLEYALSTPSGSFAQAALGEVLEHAGWADGTLFAGDLGHNSETAIVLEKFFAAYSGPLTVAQDAMEYCLAIPLTILERPGTLLVVTMAQLQKLAMSVNHDKAFTLGMDLIHLVDNLHSFSALHKANIIVKQGEHVLVAMQGQVSSTRLAREYSFWRVRTAAYAAVWWLQNSGKPFESITTAVHQCFQADGAAGENRTLNP